MLASSTTTENHNKLLLRNVSNTSDDLPPETATFVLEAVGDNIIHYLPLKDLLSISLVCTTWYSLVKDSFYIAIRIIDWKKVKFNLLEKYRGQQILHVEYMLMKEVKLSMLESRNIYNMKTIMEKIVETKYYYDCVYFTSPTFPVDRCIPEDVVTLQKRILSDINTLEEMILKTSTNMPNSLSMVRQRFLKFLLGEKPPIRKKRKIFHELCITGGEIIKRDPRYSNVRKA